ncbi:MAG: biopolymer transporter ExbD [Acetobacteraceae bacterium]|nr:biopolymer transporter ExbD [Acetobacteraceae bacterium]
MLEPQPGHELERRQELHLLATGVTVDLPRATAPRLAAPEPPIELGVTRDGRVFLGTEELPKAELPARLTALHAVAPDRALHLRGDRGVEYGEVLRIMGIVNRAGIQRVALVAQPER